jgi:hypothetical protein
LCPQVFLPHKLSTSGDKTLAESCQAPLRKNPSFLPAKWARTYVVTVLQQIHNADVEITFELAQPPTMYCEQRANYVLDLHLPLADSLAGRSDFFERRAKPRSSNPLPARVWGVDSDDDPFSIDCLLDNMSASGLYLRLPRKMNFSSAISIVVRLLHGPLEGMSAAIKGTVIRNEWNGDGHTGVGVRIVEHRFI